MHRDPFFSLIYPDRLRSAEAWHRTCSSTATEATRIPAQLRSATAEKQTEEKQMRFSGTSNNGDFQEALGLAIAAAKKKLGELVNWKLLQIHGVNGGIRGQNDLTVEIEAAAP
jgi:hypothetical protein